MSKSNTKFRLGDKVRVVNYGHLICSTKEDMPTLNIISIEKGLVYYDMNHDLVGKIGIIDNAHQTQGIDRYSINGIPTKHAWYDNQQLELIYRPDYDKR